MSWVTRNQSERDEELPVASEEDVEFSEELADAEDLEARQRAQEADDRAAVYEGTD